MIQSGSIKSSEEMAGVVQIVNYYAAVTHVQGKIKKFITERLEDDENTAFAAAKTFADTNEMRVSKKLVDSQNIIMTIYQLGSIWYPAKLYPYNIKLLKGKDSLGGTKEETLKKTETMALRENALFMPSLGELIR